MYSALLLHKEGQAINESNVRKVIEAAGGKPDENKIKALIVALKDVDIDKVIKEAATIPTAIAPATETKKEVKEEKEEEEKVSEEKAAAGLSSLFG